MEQGAAQYWVLMKKKMKNNNVLHSETCCNEETSWEERAFEKDHAAHVMWPPRSYPCTFCKREFRSAQALGGHMNVHRRDRARLKLGSSTTSPLSPSSSSRVSATIKVVRVHGDEEGDMGSSLSIGLSCKRAKLSVSSPSSLQFSLKPCLQGGDMGIGFKAGSMEDLDLELRLGHDPQQVK